MIAEPGLKPCPFCGGKDIRFGCASCGKPMELFFISFLKCDTCGAQTKAFRFEGNGGREADLKAIKAWNRRLDG